MQVERHLDPTEKLTNVQAYGEADPWEFQDSHAVYTVELECADGKEVKLTRLCVYQHAHTGKVEKCLEDQGRIVFVFHDEWPCDDVITRSGIDYTPYVSLVV